MGKFFSLKTPPLSSLNLLDFVLELLEWRIAKVDILDKLIKKYYKEG